MIRKTQLQRESRTAQVKDTNHLIDTYQPITRDGLKDIFGKEISRDLIGRLHAQGLIGKGPRVPRAAHPIPMSPQTSS